MAAVGGANWACDISRGTSAEKHNGNDSITTQHAQAICYHLTATPHTQKMSILSEMGINLTFSCSYYLQFLQKRSQLMKGNKSVSKWGEVRCVSSLKNFKHLDLGVVRKVKGRGLQSPEEDNKKLLCLQGHTQTHTYTHTDEQIKYTTNHYNMESYNEVVTFQTPIPLFLPVSPTSLPLDTLTVRVS